MRQGWGDRSSRSIVIVFSLSVSAQAKAQLCDDRGLLALRELLGRSQPLPRLLLLGRQLTSFST
ncbi:predicted protein [Streptomyces iranensis]|uniref:Uncharacterized protein n=1 Tax=Streptomyces iranensis TaxID=576784 RepID=A0A060ZKQ4_9ACTN|nr:predicted protein [Streptomyces iranensis]